MDEPELINRLPVKARSLPHLMSNDQAAIMDYVARIRGRFPNRVLAVALFGSKARGDADAESDIDLLVLVDTEDREFRSELWRIASDVSLDYNVVLSARVFGQDRWAEARRMRLPLYRAIVADGVPLTSEYVPV
jgi:predicted nucleotidyltransferase